MGVKAKIYDGKGSKNSAHVDYEGNVHVVEHPHPPLEEAIQSFPFRQRMSNSAGVTNMNVNGSATYQDFTIDAEAEYDVFIKTLFVEIEDGGTPTLNKFGALTALTNGVGMYYFTQETGLYELHEGIKTNKEFIRIGIDTHGIGTGTDAYLADVSGGAAGKSYMPIIDWGEMCGMRYGLRLKKGTNDRLVFRIQDDLTGLITFDAIAYGIRI